MDTTSLFTAALQLPDPWRVSGVEFRDEEDGRRELHIAIGFAAGSRFPCPEPGCGEAACPVHDARERVWRHLNFFQYKAFIHAGVPRVTCPAHGVHAVPVPWARPGSGVYGQINVYGVTTKSERHKRSYWTRTADGNGIGGRKAPVPYGS